MKPEFFLSLKGYKPKYLLADASSGFLVAVVSLPLCIALGIQSGFTLQAGLIAAIIGGFLISLLGGSKFTAGGPSATFVVVTVSYVSNPAIGISGMLLITIFAGIILIAAGFCHAGKLLKFVPLPVVIGFTAGVGIILLIAQLKDFFGLTLPAGTSPDFIPKITAVIKALPDLQWRPFLIGAISLTLLYLISAINKKLPAVFIVVALTTAFSAIISSSNPNHTYFATVGSVYGDVKASIDFLDFASFGSVKFGALILPAFIIAFLSAIEGLMTASVTEGITGIPYNSDFELIGQGAANIGCGFFGGIPVTGALARTSFNVSNGAKSPFWGMFHTVFLVIFYVALMPVIKYIPFAVLAAILIKVAINMSRFPTFIKILKFGKRDAFCLLITFLSVLILGVAYGVLIGVAIGFMENYLVLKNPLTISIGEKTVRKVSAETELSIVEINVSGALNFNTVNRLAAEINTVLESGCDAEINCRDLKRIDASACDRLRRVSKSRTHHVLVSGMRGDVLRRYAKGK